MANKSNENRKAGKNKGEVSELYVFLVILRDGKIRTTIKDEETQNDIEFIIQRIIGGGNSSGCTYIVNNEKEEILIEENGEILDAISHDVVENDVNTVFSKLNEKCDGGVLNFDTGEIESRYHLRSIVAGPSTKEDIILNLYDNRFKTSHTYPFSIKSFIGSNPTLLNASTTTNVVYRIEGNLTAEDVDEINSLTDAKNGEKRASIQKRLKAILEKGCTLKFEKIDNDVFSGNLQLIDAALPEIVNSMLIERYVNNRKDLREIVEILKEKNPLNFKGKQEFYKAKVCRLLMDSFMGMKPSEIWNGCGTVHGGYIVVNRNGDIVCNPLSNHEVFENYLLAHTYLEIPSTQKHKFGSIEKDDGGWIIKLNLDIRMKRR